MKTKAPSDEEPLHQAKPLPFGAARESDLMLTLPRRRAACCNSLQFAIGRLPQPAHQPLFGKRNNGTILSNLIISFYAAVIITFEE